MRGPARTGKKSSAQHAHSAKKRAQRCVTKPFLVIFGAKIVRNMNGSCYACATLKRGNRNKDTRFLSFLGAKNMGGTSKEGVCVAGEDAWANSWFRNTGSIYLLFQSSIKSIESIYFQGKNVWVAIAVGYELPWLPTR